jgi:hypothetical protein
MVAGQHRSGRRRRGLEHVRDVSRPRNRDGRARLWGVGRGLSVSLRVYKSTLSSRLSAERHRREHPEKLARSNLARYGITLEDLDQLLRDQDYLCAICSRPEQIVDYRTKKPQRLSVDHDWKTGLIRGLLCSSCNTGIGKLDHDVEILQHAIGYLQRAVEKHKHHMTPWGFRTTARGLLAVTTARERVERAELGETAILLCLQLGVTEDQLGALRAVLLDFRLVAPNEAPLADSKVATPDLVAALEGLRGD